MGLYAANGFAGACNRWRADCEGIKIERQILKGLPKKIGKSTRYLLNEPAATSVYHSQWKLFAPENILSYPEQGQNEIA